MINKKEPIIYEICVKESLSDIYRGWFEGMDLIIQADGSTLLTGPVIDQSALLGLLNMIIALGITLVSVNAVQHSV